MNLPNKLTMLRVLMIPVFLLFFHVRAIPWHTLWALLVFAAASVTDCLDGQIARRRGLITDFGKFMDPLADKVLVMTAVLCFVGERLVPAWAAALILARELAVTGLRTLAAGAGRVLAADKWGKLKTVTQMVWVVYGLLLIWITESFDLGYAAPAWLYGVFLGLMLLVLLATVGSGANYLYRNRELFADR